MKLNTRVRVWLLLSSTAFLAYLGYLLSFNGRYNAEFLSPMAADFLHVKNATVSVRRMGNDEFVFGYITNIENKLFMQTDAGLYLIKRRIGSFLLVNPTNSAESYLARKHLIPFDFKIKITGVNDF